MRGKAPHNRAFSQQSGITPAYAGKSVLHILSRNYQWDHPRLCGEKCSNENRRRIMIGSPPPMRGKATAGKTWARVAWITPAYAGKSSYQCTVSPSFRDHPRLCGEKRCAFGNSRYRLRITPAYAGKSFSCSRSSNSG